MEIKVWAKAIAAGIAAAGALAAITHLDRANNPFVMEGVSNLSDVMTTELGPNERGHAIARIVSLNEPLVLGGTGFAVSAIVYVAGKRRERNNLR